MRRNFCLASVAGDWSKCFWPKDVSSESPTNRGADLPCEQGDEAGGDGTSEFLDDGAIEIGYRRGNEPVLKAIRDTSSTGCQASGPSQAK